MAKKKADIVETKVAPIIEKVEVAEAQEVTTKTVCSNCDDSGKACSVCHAGSVIE